MSRAMSVGKGGIWSCEERSYGTIWKFQFTFLSKAGFMLSLLIAIVPVNAVRCEL